MEIDNRYWAGLFDGEGNIYVAKDVRHIQVNITQKEIPILYLLKNRFGGRISKYGNEACNRWAVVSAADCRNFLQAIAPYAIVKAIEIRCAIEILDNWPDKNFNKGWNAGKKLSAEEEQRRLSVREKLMEDRKLDKSNL